MKHLFDVNDRFTDKANSISLEMENAIAPILEKYHAEQYSIRDLEYLFHSAVTIQALSRII